jgi:DnaJ-domain-containing protein 1
VIEVLYFSDKHVKARLFGHVMQAPKLTLVTVVPPHRASKNPSKVEPFAFIESEWGELVDQVLVVDEGTAEGMWRDPVVDLADHLFPDDTTSAYAAARGYFFVCDGNALATVKKHGEPEEDLWFIQEALSQLDASVPEPDPSKRPGRDKPEVGGGAKPKRKAKQRPVIAAKTIVDEDAELPDAFSVLGVTPGCSLEEARRAWKTLMLQYHPDKVAHLGPEFQALAEQKTRELMEAWAAVQKQLEGTVP